MTKKTRRRTPNRTATRKTPESATPSPAMVTLLEGWSQALGIVAEGVETNQFQTLDELGRWARSMSAWHRESVETLRAGGGNR